MSEMKLGFEMRRIRLALTDILPVRQVKDPQNNIRRYRTIRASIKEVGLIEPLMVYPHKGGAGKYLLLDGHLRHFALKELGQTEAECLVALDDEGFTYNARVNRLNPIAEHKMIMKAVNSGVRPERIAAALNRTIQHVKACMTLLDGIHVEAADSLKDKGVSPKAIRLLRKVTAVRQIEIADLMVSANNFTAGYAEALVLGTPKDQLANPEEPKQKKGLSREEVAKMEEEMETLERDLKAVDESYGENMLNLTLARGYIKKLLNNAKVIRFMHANYPDMFSEFESIGAAETL
jgi:ParB-like chromosome segregation protein Spo0J